MLKQKHKLTLSSTLAILLASVSVGSVGNQTFASNANKQEGSSLITIDGSSTVFPITEAMAEEFQIANPGIRITVGISGTGGGFKKFCAGETDISNASRPIKEEEIALCEQAGIEYIELPVSYDGLSVVVSQQNDWVDCLTTEELKKMWEPAAQGTITNWNQIRADFPDQPLALYGPGTDSGTFDYFTGAIVGEESASRGDFTASEDDNVIVQGVASDPNALGYFGLAYYAENQDSLKLVSIDDGDPSNGDGCITPSAETVNDGTYQPLARPEFIYVKKEALARPEVQSFVDYYLDPANSELVSEVGYIPMSEAVYQGAQNRLANQTTGTVFEGGSTVGVNLEEEYAQ